MIWSLVHRQCYLGSLSCRGRIGAGSSDGNCVGACRRTTAASTTSAAGFTAAASTGRQEEEDHDHSDHQETQQVLAARVGRTEGHPNQCYAANW